MTSNLTRVGLAFLPERLNVWLRFGHPVAERVLDRRRSLVLFAPGAVFAHVRWEANDYGTTLWQLHVLRAVAPGETAATVSGIAPGADILLRASGVATVKRVLSVIDAIEAQDINPANVAPSYWRVANNRLARRMALRPYGAPEHAAHLAREAMR